ncbi:MAG: nitroreductase family protein, partial [Chlamydiia bacterium]|nr:nitroreductase family protein [Chlamydiia bacterium]
KSWFEGNDALIQETAFRNSTLQAAYFMLAARALGLDCGPMSGFDQQKCNAAFFPEGRFKSNFLCNLGYGDPKSLYPRSPRPDFSDFCKIV